MRTREEIWGEVGWGKNAFSMQRLHLEVLLDIRDLLAPTEKLKDEA